MIIYMQIYQFKVLSDGYVRPIEPTEKKNNICVIIFQNRSVFIKSVPALY